MKKITILFFLHFVVASTQAQQLYPIKESYDQLLEPNYGVSSYNNDASLWWEGWGWTLLSYLKMFEVTYDKAYLNKFIRHSYNIQLRQGNNHLWNMMPSNGGVVLYTGQLLRPMAEFVYLVKNDPALYNTNLIGGIIPMQLQDPSQTILGYGDYANWLETRVKQSMDKMIDLYWIDDINCFQRKLTGNDYPIEINFNASYASTMFYIGNVDPVYYSSYITKAINIVDFFKNRVSEYFPNQTYTWLHSDFDPNQPQNFFREDVSHGGIDIQIPFVAYQLYGNGLYQPSELNKFARTFTFNIWDRYNQVFHNNVFGLDADIANGFVQNTCGYYPNGTPNYYGPGEVLTWMPLYQYENPIDEPNDVYTVLITQAVKLLTDDPTAFLPPGYCYSSTRSLSGAQSFYGLSEVVKAQWDKECINLTLYNREVAYDQDFSVKNILTIAPENGNVNSFADPVINTPEFIVNANITSNIDAGEYISLKPGTRFLSGSNVSLKIKPNQCTDGNIIGDPEVKSQMDNENSEVSLINDQAKTGLTASPNPFTHTVSLHFNLPLSAEVSLIIYDNLGNVCYNEIKNRKMDAGDFTIPISTEKWANGIYHCVMLTNGNEIKTCKIIRTE